MNHLIAELFVDAQSNDTIVYDKALTDLRFIIERHTMNRYEDEEYRKMFYRKSLIELRISENEICEMKYFLVFLLFNFPDRSVLTAKCVKVLFDTSISEAICNAIELYMSNDDNTTCELIYALTDVYEDQSYFSNHRIKMLLNRVRESGKSLSKEYVEALFSLR